MLYPGESSAVQVTGFRMHPVNSGRLLKEPCAVGMLNLMIKVTEPEAQRGEATQLRVHSG